MSENEQQNNSKGKTGAQVLAEVEDKNLSGELGKIRKLIEEKVPVRDKAQEALDQVNTELKDLVQRFDEVSAKRKK